MTSYLETTRSRNCLEIPMSYVATGLCLSNLVMTTTSLSKNLQ